MKKKNQNKEKSKRIKSGIRLNCPTEKVIVPKNKRKPKHKEKYDEE